MRTINGRKRRSQARKSGIKIDKGVPPPLPKREWVKDIFSKMQVGDSFVIGSEETNRARNAAISYGLGNNKKFVSRKDENGVRFWRIE